MPLAPALIDLVPLIMFAVALALCVLSLYIAKALFGAAGGAVGWIPGVGGWLKGKIEDVAHKITSGLGHAATVLEARVGASWHSFARLVDWMGRELARHAALIERIAHDLVTGNIIDLIRLEIQGARKLERALHRAIVGIGHDLGIRVKGIERGIGADVLPRIRSLDRRLSREVTREKARARAAEHALDREVTALGKWVRSHPWTIVTDAFVGAVAIALTKLGLDWIKCDSAKKLAKKRGCGMWDDLDSLLGLAVTAIAIADLKTLVREAQKVEHATAEAIETLLRV